MTNNFLVALALLLLLEAVALTHGFLATSSPHKGRRGLHQIEATKDDRASVSIGNPLSRRSVIQTTFFAGMFAVSTPARAAERQPLDALLYRILRVREATQQETRLIKSGKFKDFQRANVKLAVRFMIENYQLNDAFVAASGYLDGNNRRVEAGQVGQTAVQNLYTILEYFDSSGVENIKVGQTSMAGKEEIVLKGLDATRQSIDNFLAYFPMSDVDAVTSRVSEENRLNVKEFDPALGDLLNMPPPK